MDVAVTLPLGFSPARFPNQIPVSGYRRQQQRARGTVYTGVSAMVNAKQTEFCVSGFSLAQNHLLPGCRWWVSPSVWVPATHTGKLVKLLDPAFILPLWLAVMTSKWVVLHSPLCLSLPNTYHK